MLSAMLSAMLSVSYGLVRKTRSARERESASANQSGSPSTRRVLRNSEFAGLLTCLRASVTCSPFHSTHLRSTDGD